MISGENAILYIKYLSKRNIGGFLYELTQNCHVSIKFQNWIFDPGKRSLMVSHYLLILSFKALPQHIQNIGQWFNWEIKKYLNSIDILSVERYFAIKDKSWSF